MPKAKVEKIKYRSVKVAVIEVELDNDLLRLLQRKVEGSSVSMGEYIRAALVMYLVDHKDGSH